MKFCACGNQIPRRCLIDGKIRNLQNRSKCLICLPFGQSPYRKKSKEEIRSFYADKSRRWYKRIKDANGGTDPINLIRAERRNFILSLLGSKCQKCGYSKCSKNLAFHHLGDKRHALSGREFQFGLEKILPELLKCVLICHNCHGEIHDGLISQENIEEMHKTLMASLEHLKDKKWQEVFKGSWTRSSVG